MAKISIVASGSRGDVQPYVALGAGLQAAGYAVQLLANDDFATLVTDARLDFRSIGTSIEALVQTDEWRKTLEGGNFLAILGKMRSEMQGAATVFAERIPDLLHGSDLIITGMAGMAGVFAAAEKVNIPLVQAYVFPFTPTRAFAGPIIPALSLGGLLNRVSFHITHQLFWQSSKIADTTTRRMLGMPRSPFWGPFRRLHRRRTPVLYGYSPSVLPRPHDWEAHQQVTGYWFLDEPSGWTPPADLLDFLQAGPPPVFIGFGSMGNRNPAEAARIVLGALARSGQRGVLASGWGGLQPTDLPDTVHMISSIPHSWLFPRMAAVVHHGGAGTTAAGLRAGVPSIVIPFMADQPFWGRRVAALGVGPKPIPRKRLTGERLAAAITQAVSDAEMRRTAAELGQKIRNEDGVATAVTFIHQFERKLSHTG